MLRTFSFIHVDYVFLLKMSIKITQTWRHGYFILFFQNNFPIEADSRDHPLLKHDHIGRFQVEVAVLLKKLLRRFQGELTGHYIPVRTRKH